MESNYRDGLMDLKMFSIKNIDVRMSKPKKNANKVRMTGWMWFYNTASPSFFINYMMLSEM